MQQTHRYLIKKAIYDYGTNDEQTRIDWIDKNLGMICLAANNVWFTAEMEDVFHQMVNGRKNAMRDLMEKQRIQLNDLMAKGLKFN